MKKALVCGVSGQDGAFLSRLLLRKGYRVFGTSRDAQGSNFSNLAKLGIKDQVTTLSMDPEDFRSVIVAIRASEPAEVYFLAGQSSVGLSFEQPVETIQSHTLGTLNLLEACKMHGTGIKQYYAGSSEIFGDSNGTSCSEETPFKPRSPYAVGKASSFWLVDNYREAYGLYACTGILFNHESPLRPARFVTKKIVDSAKRISKGSNETLELGRLDITRDWGWAPKYVEAMWLMLQQDKPDDFVIATGKSHTLSEFVETVFSSFDLDWQNYVKQNTKFMRPTDIAFNQGNPDKARRVLGWDSELDMYGVIERLINDSLE